jgi:hypothetical protein
MFGERRHACLLGIVAAVLAGCGGSTASSPDQGAAGSGGSGSMGSGGNQAMAGGGNATPDASDGPGDAPSMGLVGTWKGYVENFKFKDDTDAVLLVITSEAGAGHITFGNSPAPPPATDPNVGYPPDVKSAGPGGMPPFTGPYAGFAFTLVDPTYANDRLQFTIAVNELYAHWCELQTPILDEANAGGMYFCAHNWGFRGGGPTACSQPDPSTMMDVPIDCEKLRLCQPGGACACTAQSCTVSLFYAVLHFDMTVAGSKANGSAQGLDQELHNVHFTKQ